MTCSDEDISPKLSSPFLGIGNTQPRGRADDEESTQYAEGYKCRRVSMTVRVGMGESC